MYVDMPLDHPFLPLDMVSYPIILLLLIYFLGYLEGLGGLGIYICIIILE